MFRRHGDLEVDGAASIDRAWAGDHISTVAREIEGLKQSDRGAGRTRRVANSLSAANWFRSNLGARSVCNYCGNLVDTVTAW